MNPTFEDFLTPAGVIVAAGLITGFIQLIKAVIPVIDEKISGALMAFVLSALLYVATAAAVGITDANSGLAIFLAWLACATAAVGIKSTADHVTSGTDDGPPDA